VMRVQVPPPQLAFRLLVQPGAMRTYVWARLAWRYVIRRRVVRGHALLMASVASSDARSRHWRDTRGVGHDTQDWLHALPQPLRDGVRFALADLQQPTAVPFERVTYEPDRETEQFGMLTVWFSDGSGGGLGLSVGNDRAEVIAEVADRIQELLQEEREAWGEARPACPGHTHPAVAMTVEGTACWVCPNDSRVIARIGHLKGA
jgi:hypothetical protein